MVRQKLLFCIIELADSEYHCENEFKIIKGSKIKLKGQKLMLGFEFFTSTNVNQVVKCVSVLTLSSQSNCKICVNFDTFFTTQLIHIFHKTIDSKIQSDFEESVNIDAYFTTQFTFVDTKNTHHCTGF